MRGWWVGLVAACLTACAQLPDRVAVPALRSVGDFQVFARFSLRRPGGESADQNLAGRLHWVHAPDRDALVFSDPLSRGLAALDLDKQGARLRLADGRTYAAADADALMLQTLGYPLPVRRLVAWMVPPVASQRDELGRPVRYAEAGWLIEYVYADADARRPDRLTLRHAADDGPGQIELRVRIEEWSE